MGMPIQQTMDRYGVDFNLTIAQMSKSPDGLIKDVGTHATSKPVDGDGRF